MTATMTVNLTITATPTAPRIALCIPKDVSPSSLRALVSDATKIPLVNLRLIFRGRMIGDDETKNAVEEFKLEDGTVLHCMGKPEEETTAAATHASGGSTVTIAPPAAVPAATSSNPLKVAFATIRSSSPPQTYLVALKTLEKILSNIISHPMEEKYRKVKKNNSAFQSRLGGVTGGDDAMRAAGFVTQMDSGEEVYMMHASAEKWPQLMNAKTIVEEAVGEATAAGNPPPPMPNVGMPNFGNIPGMGAGMGPGFMGADTQSAVAARILADPNMLQSMLQNPMVQNIMRNDPRFAQNPMMRQSMEQLANNPEMLQQMAQMMADPAAMQQLQAMMGGANRAGLGAMSGGLGGLPPFGGARASNNNSQQAGGALSNDDELTEEEMIAEAIRRSLEE